jgi:hypothetical protein
MDPEKRDLQSEMSDEKGLPVYSSEKGVPSSPAQSVDEVEWTPEEEKKLVRKIDTLIMPLLMMAFFSLQLDRGRSSRIGQQASC